MIFEYENRRLGAETIRAEAESFFTEAKNENEQNGKKKQPNQIGYVFGELENLSFPQRDEIIKGLSRSETGLLNAVTNTGKTTLIRIVSLCLIIGRTFLPLVESGKRRRVAIIDTEDLISYFRSDIHKMMQDFTEEEKQFVRENLLLISDVRSGDEELTLNKPEHFASIAERIQEFQTDIIFVDTISSSFAIRNENDNAEIKEVVMKPLKRLSRICDAAVLAVHHIGKARLEEGGSRENAHKGRGASAFSDLSRVVFNLEKDAAGDVVLSCAKLKGEKFADTRLKYDKETRWFSVAGEKKSADKYEILMELFVNDEVIKRAEIDSALEAVMSKASITRYLSTAVERGELFNEKGFYSKDAQMLTPNSVEHLSIPESDAAINQTEGDTQESNTMSKKRKCPECEGEMMEDNAGKLFCRVCLYS